jgi:hypothetical protein
MAGIIPKMSPICFLKNIRIMLMIEIEIIKTSPITLILQPRFIAEGNSQANMCNRL